MFRSINCRCFGVRSQAGNVTSTVVTGYDERTRELFEDHLWKAKRLLARRSCFDVLEILHRDVISDPSEQASRINAFLGERLDIEPMAAVVDERLYRNRR